VARATGASVRGGRGGRRGAVAARRCARLLSVHLGVCVRVDCAWARGICIKTRMCRFIAWCGSVLGKNAFKTETKLK
jgi:hypothetical protein